MPVRSRALLAALAAGLFLAGGARADRLDAEMNKKMPEVVEQLKKAYKTVGVLRFRVQDAGQKESFNSPLSGRMAERVETLLILHAGETEAKALGVVRDVGLTASKAKVGGWYGSAAERKKLFEQAYPMAWGAKTAKVDAFLTGKVELTPDRSKTTVTVEYFDKNDPGKVKTLARFTESTTVYVLRDMGHGFVLSRGAKNDLKALKRNTTSAASRFAIRTVNLNQPGQQNAEGGEDKTEGETGGKAQPQTQASPKNLGGIEFQMLVNDRQVGYRSTGSQDEAKHFEVESPTKGSKVGFRLKNTTDKWLAVALRLNGVNTINERTGDVATSQKWAVPPGKSYLIQGFYEFPPPQDAGLMHKPFKVLVGQEAQEYKGQEMGDKKGLIEVDVFEAGAAGGGGDEQEMFVTPRGLPPSALRKERATFQGLRSALLKNAKLKARSVSVREGSLVVKRELIVPDEEAIAAEGVSLKIKEIPNPMPVGGLTIKVLPGKSAAQGE
ncbi:MAG: hypothetical protein U0797_14785 [Gemmataceae bacterium]